jgi:hypothetical protein
MSTTAEPNYLSPAFYSQYNLILLGGSALFSLASASPLPLLIGAAGELLWLGLGSRLPAFRRRVDAQADGERREQLDDEVLRGMRGLEPEHAARLVAVGQNISWVLLRAEPSAKTMQDRAALAELEQLRPAFLRLCLLRERLGKRLEELRQSPPEHEVAQLSQAYAAEKDIGHRLTIHQAIKQAQRKIEQQSRFAELARQVELKLSLIEQSLAQLRGQQQHGTGSGDLTRDVQNVMHHATGLAALEAEVPEA